MSKFQTLKNSAGYSLVEVMLVVSIMGIVGLGAASMMKNSMSVQRRQELKPTLRVIKFEVEQAIRNDQAWENTINHPDNGGAVANQLGCLIDGDGTPCTNGTVINNPHIVDETGASVWNGTDGAAGWTFSGVECGAWAAAGNNGCPIRYNMQVGLTCRGGAPNCNRPSVRIFATINYAPANAASVENRINILDYQIDIWRDERVRYEPFTIVGEQDNGEFGGHGGPCTDGAGVRRKLTRIVSGMGRTSNTVADNVTLNTATDEFTLTGPGYYNCEITAEGWNAVEGYQVRIEAAGFGQSLGGGVSGIPGQGSTPMVAAVSRVKASVRLDVPGGGRAYRIVHYCYDIPDNTPDINVGSPAGISSDNGGDNRTMGLGVPVGEHDPNNPKVFTRIECIRTT